MMESLLKLFGIGAHSAERLVQVRPVCHAGLHPFLLILIAVLLAAWAVWLYRREQGECPPWRRRLMTACRILFFLLLFTLLLRPVLAVTVAGAARQSLVVLIDTSGSMDIADVRDQPADQARAVAVLGQTPASPISRLDLVKAALNSRTLDLLSRLGQQYQLSYCVFDRQLRDLTVEGATRLSPAPWAADLKADGEATAIGDAVRDVIIAKRGQSLAGIWLITDGAGNHGLMPVEAARMAGEERVPLYCYGVGITSPRDIVVSAVIGPDVAFVHDELTVSVRLRGQGMKGQRGTLVLALDGSPVDEKEVVFDQEEEQAVAMRFIPQKTGDFALEASIAPRPDEVVKDNNTSPPRRLRVVDGRIKVLHVEQSPRWEFKYLQAMLQRDRRVDYRCWLLEADPGVVQPGNPNSPYVSQFPPKKEDLLQYDLVILGDVDPKRLSPLAIDNLGAFVSNFGGGMILIAGKRFMPAAYRRTGLEKMFPVDLDMPASVDDIATGQPVRLEPTASGKVNPMLRLSEKEADTAKIWEQLPPVYWTARVARAKPAADVLLVDPDPAKASRFGKMPVMALQQYGMGQVLYMGTDNTWRWRKNENERVFEKIWGQIVERMALAHVLGLAKRTQLSTDKDKYAAGDRITLYARLYREKDFEPVAEPSVKAAYRLKGEAGASRELLLRALPDQPGMYRGEFVAPGPGAYQLQVETDNKTWLDFLVAPSKAEMGETALNETVLRAMAEKSGGRFLREEDLQQLPDMVHSTTQPVYSTYEVDIWSSPAFFLVTLAAVSLEWFLRKRSQLK